MAYDRAFIAKIFPVLEDVFESTVASIFAGRLYATVGPPKPTLPQCVYQSQDAGGKRADYINQNGWNGLITFRSMDTTKSGAWDRAIQLLEQLPNVTASGIVLGYYIDFTAERPQWFPVESYSTGNIYTAGIVVNFTINK